MADVPMQKNNSEFERREDGSNFSSSSAENPWNDEAWPPAPVRPLQKLPLIPISRDQDHPYWKNEDQAFIDDLENTDGTTEKIANKTVPIIDQFLKNGKITPEQEEKLRDILTKSLKDDINPDSAINGHLAKSNATTKDGKRIWVQLEEHQGDKNEDVFRVMQREAIETKGFRIDGENWYMHRDRSKPILEIKISTPSIRPKPPEPAPA